MGHEDLRSEPDAGSADWLDQRAAARRRRRSPDRTAEPDPRSRLVEEHLDLVEQVVAQVAVRFPRHVDREELVRAGMVGLVEAARRFDGSRSIPFTRFAARRIRGAVLDSVRSSDWAPRSVRVQARAVDQAETHLAERLRRRPTVDETAEHLGVEAREVDRVRERVVRAALLGLDAPAAGQGEAGAPSSVAERIADDSTPEPSEELERRELHAYVRHAVAHLPERHRAVVVGYFVEQLSSEELARSLGVTVSRVSQLRTEALAAMRRGIEAQYVDLGGPAIGQDRPSLVERRRAAYADAIRTSAPCVERIASATDDGTDERFLAIIAAL